MTKVASPNRNIEVARLLLGQIRRLLTLHERGESSEGAAEAIRLLCDGLIHTIDDPQCQETLSEVERHADELFSLDGRPQFGRTARPGAMFLRRLIFRTLETFDDRLKSLEATQQPARGSYGADATVRFP